jgi:hypothetical protein
MGFAEHPVDESGPALDHFAAARACKVRVSYDCAFLFKYRFDAEGFR